MFRVLFLTLRFLVCVCVRAWFFICLFRSDRFSSPFSVCSTQSQCFNLFERVVIASRWRDDWEMPVVGCISMFRIIMILHLHHCHGSRTTETISSVRFENKFFTRNRACRLVYRRYELCEPSMSKWMKGRHVKKKHNERQRKKKLEISLRRHLSNRKKKQKNLLTNACHDDKLSVFEAATQRNFYHIFSSEWHSNAMFNHADVVTLLLLPPLPLFLLFTVVLFHSRFVFFFWIFLSDFRAIPHFFMDVFFLLSGIYLFILCRPREPDFPQREVVWINFFLSFTLHHQQQQQTK